MEYMLSGTPLLTTKLPGMPKEYYPYVYLIEDENENVLSRQLIDILSTKQEILDEKGKNAQQFVLRKKNNVIQTKKIIDMVEKFIWEDKKWIFYKSILLITAVQEI